MGFILLIIDGHDMIVHYCLEIHSMCMCVCIYVYMSLASRFYVNFLPRFIF